VFLPGPPTAAAAGPADGHSQVRATGQLTALNYTSAIQDRTPDRLQSRVNAGVRVLTAGPSPVGAFLGGRLAEAVGRRAATAGAGEGASLAFV
jgi:hypothetical protein